MCGHTPIYFTLETSCPYFRQAKVSRAQIYARGEGVLDQTLQNMRPEGDCVAFFKVRALATENGTELAIP